MSNIVEFVVKMRDMLTGPLQKMGQVGTSSFSKLQQSVDKFSGNTNKLTMNVRQLEAQLQRLTEKRDISLDGSQVASINKQMDALIAKKNRLTGGGSIGGGLSSFFRQGLAIAGIGSMAFLGKDIMQAGIERQMNATALQTLLGQNAGSRLNGQLLDFAKRSIYGNEVFNEGKQMAGSGIRAGNIMPVLSMIGDIAMGDKERMKSLALAFSETSTRGKLTGQNERMFLQGGLFNPLEQLHKMTGESMNQLNGDMRKGKISINELVKAMQYATGPMGRWHDMMNKMQNTPAGQWTAFTGTVRTLAGTIGLALLPALGDVTKFMTWLIDNTDVLYSVAAAIGAMTAAWALYAIYTERAAIWQGILEVAAYWPLAIVGAIVGGIAYMMNANDSLADNTEKNAQRIGNSRGLLVRSWDNFIYVMETAFLGFISVFERFNNIMKASSLKGIGSAITGDTNADRTLAVIKRKHQEANWADLDSKNGLVDIDPKTGKPVKKSKSAIDMLMDYKPGSYQFSGGDGSTPGGDTSAAISGGGVRNITINVQKFLDKIEMHVMNLDHATPQVERILEDMFDRIVNSAATALN